jgi:hypothetical protein
MASCRVTLTLNAGLLEVARRESGGNLSRFVSELIEERVTTLQRRRLREELRAGYVAEAEADLEVTTEYNLVDRETAAFENSPGSNPH